VSRATAAALTSPRAMERSRRWIAGTVLALLAIGTVMAHSTHVLREKLAEGGDPYAPLAQHLVKLALALLACLLGTRLRPHHVFRFAVPVWLVSVALLGLVLVAGPLTNNARRWLDLGPVTFQPSELARVATMAVVAIWMVVIGPRTERLLPGVVAPLAIASLSAGLVLVEPDFGSALYLLVMAGLLVWVGGARVGHLAGAFVLAAAPVCLYAWDRLGHVKDRVLAFTDPEPFGQVHQSLIALGDGGASGVGLGGGPAKWGFLPEARTDFVLAVVGQELGFVGTAAVVLLYGLLLVHGVRLLRGLRTRFSLVLGTGLLVQVLVQAILNLAVVTGAAPPKGVPLPFVSSGGSSAIVLAFSIGLLLGLASAPSEDPSTDPRVRAGLWGRVLARWSHDDPRRLPAGA